MGCVVVSLHVDMAPSTQLRTAALLSVSMWIGAIDAVAHSRMAWLPFAVGTGQLV